jgi:hypothetical protein
MSKMIWRSVIAFFLGVIGLFGFGVGEGSGLVVMGIALGAYFCLCQFLLSRKKANAYRKDWPVMLALDAAWFYVFILMVLAANRADILAQGPAMVLGVCGGTYLGAVVASLAARRTVARS